MKTVIAGLGRTGTTALFFKLKQALPGDACYLFEPSRLQAPAGHTGDVLAKVLIGFKRTVDITSLQSFDRKVLLTRDPRDTLVSRVLYDIYNEPALCADDAKVEAFLTLLRRKEADPSGLPLREIIDVFDRMSRRPLLPRATQDPDVALDFQRAHVDFFRYRYEDLVRADFTALESYFGISLGPETASVPPEFARVSRTRNRGDWRNWLTQADVDFFRPYFAPYLIHNGYSTDWALPDLPVIRPENGSDYARRLVEERRRLTAAS